MAINSFQCPICHRYTRHIELSSAEAGAMSGEAGMSQFINAVGGDYLGGHRIWNFIRGQKFWKCCECGIGSRRDLSGTIKYCFKDKKQFVYKDGELREF